MPAVVELPKKSITTEIPQLRSKIVQNVTFFGDSAIPGGDAIYQSVYEASKILASNGYTIVDGGGPGIMKAATDGAESVNGNTVAVYWEPKLAAFFEGKNLANLADKTLAESNYVMRTFGLIEQGDVFVVCKGGTGTISEFGLVWCLGKLYYGCHKPVVLYGDFWDDLIEAFQKTMYIDEVEMAVLHRAKTPEELLKLIESFETVFSHCVTVDDKTSDELAFIINGRRDKTTESYDKLASEYHASRIGKLPSQAQLDDFVSLVHAPARVLDIGSGTGQDIAYLSKKYSTEGIEISKRMVEISKLESPNSNIMHGDIVSTNIGENKYKGIWSRDAIHHVHEDQLDGVFEKISKALVEGGIFYCIVREGQGQIEEKEQKNYGTMERFYHLFTPTELISRAEKAGLELVKIDHSKRSHKWLVGVFKKI